MVVSASLKAAAHNDALTAAGILEAAVYIVFLLPATASHWLGGAPLVAAVASRMGLGFRV